MTLLLLQSSKPEVAGEPQQKESLLSLLLNNVLKNPYIWGMALTYFFIYVVRQGVTSWFVFYLIKVRRPPVCHARCSLLCGCCRCSWEHAHPCRELAALLCCLELMPASCHACPAAIAPATPSPAE